jgi:hypothetical protein
MQPGAPVAAIPRAQGCASAENDVSPFELLPQILGQFIAGGGLVRRQGCMEAVASDGGAVGGHGWPRWLAAWSCGGTRGSRPPLPCFRTRAISHFSPCGEGGAGLGASRCRGGGLASSSSNVFIICGRGRQKLYEPSDREKGVVIALVGSS